MDGRHRGWLGPCLAGVVLLVALGGAVTAGTASPHEATVTVYATETGAFDGSEDIEAAIDDGTLEPAETAHSSDTLVVEIESARLAEDLATREGTATARFFDLLDGDADLAFYQVDASPNVIPKELEVGPDNTTVYAAGNRTFLSIDTDAVDVGYINTQSNQAPGPALEGGDTFAVTFGYDVTDPGHGPTVAFHTANASFVEHSSVLAPELVNRSVEVNVPPDQGVLVRATLDNETTITERPAPVSWAPSQGVSLDFRDVPPGTNYTLTLIHDGTVVDQQQGRVRSLSATLQNPDVRVPERESETPALQLSVNLSHGGKVAVLDGFGARLGSARLPPGTTTVSIPLESEDPATTLDPDELRVLALRTDGQIEQRYPGEAATLTLDVSEYEWDATRWTQTPPEETEPTDQSSPGDRTDQSSTDDTTTQGAVDDTTPEEYTVGGDRPAATPQFGTLAGGVGVVGAVILLGGAGYVLTRRRERE